MHTSITSNTTITLGQRRLEKCIHPQRVIQTLPLVKGDSRSAYIHNEQYKHYPWSKETREVHTPTTSNTNITLGHRKLKKCIHVHPQRYPWSKETREVHAPTTSNTNITLGQRRLEKCMHPQRAIHSVSRLLPMARTH